MKKIATTLVLLAVCASTAFASNAVRISQIYGGGGGAAGNGATYNEDYVELFNSSGAAVDLSNYAIEYGSAAGNWGSSATNIFTFPVGASIAPCGYVLVAMGPPSTGGGPLPVAADYTGTLTMSATNGKVALFSSAQPNLACAGNVGGGAYVDVVGYGSGACFETSAMGALTNVQGGVRLNGGMQDTDANAADFAVVTNPIPHNSASPANPNCLVTPTNPSSWGRMKSMYR